ncbi:STE3-like pheromone receptor [Gyrodon lividus]|nr:STE3-like pheromone receptor [Gyrodon lividus]
MPLPNSVFSVFSFAGFVLASMPLSWHLQYGNAGACMCMAWAGLACLMFFINSIVWNDNVSNSAPVWCDITSHFLIGSSVGIPACALCMIRRLYKIAKLDFIKQTHRQKKRHFYVDLLLGIGSPCVIMVLYYIVQANRFNIYERIGCYPASFDSIPAYLLVNSWPVILGLVQAVYAGLTLRIMLRKKSRMNELLRSNRNGNITKAQNWRLLAFCITEIVFAIPLGSYVIAISAAGGQIQPYVSWSNVHRDFSRVNQITVSEWHNMAYASVLLETNRWLYVICAFFLFGIFGLAQEARKTYRRCYSAILRGLTFSGNDAHARYVLYFFAGFIV